MMPRCSVRIDSASPEHRAHGDRLGKAHGTPRQDAGNPLDGVADSARPRGHAPGRHIGLVHTADQAHQAPWAERLHADGRPRQRHRRLHRDRCAGQTADSPPADRKRSRTDLLSGGRRRTCRAPWRAVLVHGADDRRAVHESAPRVANSARVNRNRTTTGVPLLQARSNPPAGSNVRLLRPGRRVPTPLPMVASTQRPEELT